MVGPPVDDILNNAGWLDDEEIDDYFPVGSVFLVDVDVAEEFRFVETSPVFIDRELRVILSGTCANVSFDSIRGDLFVAVNNHVGDDQLAHGRRRLRGSLGPADGRSAEHAY